MILLAPAANVLMVMTTPVPFVATEPYDPALPPGMANVWSDPSLIVAEVGAFVYPPVAETLST